MTSNGGDLQPISSTIEELRQKVMRRKEMAEDRYLEAERERRIAEVMRGPEGWDESSIYGRWLAARARGEDLVGLCVQFSALPPETRDSCRFHTFRTNKKYPALASALEAARQWGKPGGTKLVTLAGPPGVGKTHLLLSAAWDLVEKGTLALYLSQGALLKNGPRGAERFLEEAERIVFVLLDDLGSEGMAYDWVRAILDRLIDDRWVRGMPLMVATNLKSEELPPRLVDRLGDTRIGQVVPIEAPSGRSKKA